MSETIRLDQYLKVAGIAETGGQAKMLVRSGEILVNGEVVTQRGRLGREPAWQDERVHDKEPR